MGVITNTLQLSGDTYISPIISTIYTGDTLLDNNDNALVSARTVKQYVTNTIIVSGGTSALSGLTDVTITSPIENDILTYDNGGNWVNSADYVRKVSTPSNDEVGIWTGDGTIEGNSNLRFNTNMLYIQGGISVENSGNVFFDTYETGQVRLGDMDGIDTNTYLDINVPNETFNFYNGEIVTNDGIIKSSVVDGASSIGINIQTTNTFSTVGSKLLNVKNNTGNRFHIEHDGTLWTNGDIRVSADNKIIFDEDGDEWGFILDDSLDTYGFGANTTVFGTVGSKIVFYDEEQTQKSQLYGLQYHTDEFVEFTEMTAPANPVSNHGRLYVADDGGTTTLYFKDSAGVATDLLAGGGGSSYWTASSTDIYNSNAGDVGIGGAPTGTAKLHVHGGILGDVGGDTFFESNWNGSFKIGDMGALGDQAYIEGDSTNIYIWNDGVKSMEISPNNHIGMGVVPGATYKLDVSGSGRYSSSLTANNFIANGSGVDLFTGTADGGYTTGYFQQSGNGRALILNTTGTQTEIAQFRDGGTAQFTFSTTGDSVQTGSVQVQDYVEVLDTGGSEGFKMQWNDTEKSIDFIIN